MSALAERVRSTTILAVRRGAHVSMVGDGQVTQGSVVLKGNARKVRQVVPGVVCGFAGSTADAMTLFDRLKAQLEDTPGQLLRGCVELAKQWRTDKYLRRLEAVMLVADAEQTLMLTGLGDVIEPAESGVIGIGSGGNFASAAALALVNNTDLSAEECAVRAMRIAAEMCVYTNDSLIIETLPKDGVQDRP